MVVLIVLLAVLFNLGFGQTQTPSDSPSGAIDVLVEQHREAIRKMREAYGITKTEGCKYTMDQLRRIANNHNMLRLYDGRVFIELPDPDGSRLYQVDDTLCRIIKYEVSGTLSPPLSMSVAPIGQQILTKQNIKFGVDVNLFQVLFQLLMYGAGIFWAVRVAGRFIEGDMSGAAVSFLQGFIIVATMYVLYRMM